MPRQPVMVMRVTGSKPDRSTAAIGADVFFESSGLKNSGTAARKAAAGAGKILSRQDVAGASSRLRYLANRRVLKARPFSLYGATSAKRGRKPERIAVTCQKDGTLSIPTDFSDSATYSAEPPNNAFAAA